jgi:hypothetical protein
MRWGPLVLVVVAALPAHADMNEPTPELVADRDRLLERIVRGQDGEGAARDFRALLEKRAAKVQAPIMETAAREKAAADARARRAADEKSLDYEVGWRCRLSADPAHPPLVNDDMFMADWGKVARKERLTVPGNNALADDETLTMYEVRGARRAYRIDGDHPGAHDPKLEAAVGDWVLVCENVEPPDRDPFGRDSIGPRLPASWQPRERTGAWHRIARPPRIAQKRKWNPIHTTKNKFFWAIRDVKWPFPDGAYVVTRAEVLADLGGGRFEIDAQQRSDEKTSWVLEVPPEVRGRALLGAGRVAWVVAGHPRFDRSMKKLVLTCEDIEERYIDEK